MARYIMSEAAEAKLNQGAQGMRANLESAQAEAVSREQAFQLGKNLDGKVVVITGAGSGFGKQFAITAASYGASVYLSDLSPNAARSVAAEVKANGGRAYAYDHKCDTSIWEDQVGMFKAARVQLGEIDVVVPNAGVGEMSELLTDKTLYNGDPAPPNLLTLSVNLVGVIYTAKLAFFHLRQNPKKEGKAIVFVGSLASLTALPKGPVYGSAKHGVLGLFRSCYYNGSAEGINCNIICPWFTDTGIISPLNRAGLFGLPYCEQEDVIAAMVRAAADPKCQGEAMAIDADGILSIPFTAFAPGQEGYFAEFERRAHQSITNAAKVEQLVKIVQATYNYWFRTKKSKFFGFVLAVIAFGKIRQRRALGRAP